MVIEILLGVLFVTSTSVLWYLLSQKLPEVIAIPDHVIAERMKEDATKFHLFLLQFKSFFKEGRYKYVLGQVMGKFLHRLHIILMRFDNAVMALLRTIRTRQNSEEQNGKESSAVSPLPVSFQQEVVMAPVPHEPSFRPMSPVMAPAMSSVVVRPKRVAITAELKEQVGLQQIPLARKVSLNHLHAIKERQVQEKAESAPSSAPQEETLPKRRVRRSKIVPPEIRE